MIVRWKPYIILGCVAAVSFISVSIPASELIKAVVAAPGVIALLAVLFQLMRDEAAHEKQVEKQLREFQFSIGSASHMANVAFDKHTEFCERYMSEVHETVRAL